MNVSVWKPRFLRRTSCRLQAAYGAIFQWRSPGMTSGAIATWTSYWRHQKVHHRGCVGHFRKVLIHGHMSLYRNCEEANHYFRLKAQA